MTILRPRDYEYRAAEWYGWKPARPPHDIGLYLTGRRRRDTKTTGCHGWDTAHFRRLALDHVRAWTDKDGNRLITFEPYFDNLESPTVRDALFSFTSYAFELGLEVQRAGESVYFPGECALFIVRARSER